MNRKNGKNGSHTAGKLPNPVPNNKPFVKGDPRINRNGRPKGFDELRKLAQSIAHEIVRDKKGKPLKDHNGDALTMADAMLRAWTVSGEPSLQKAFMEYAYGKVPDKIEGDPLGKFATLILHYDHERKVEEEKTARNGNGL